MAEQIIQLATTVLKIHPRNNEFFDDINGEDYIRFKQSIADDGVITPLIVATDMTIISGHQRHKACIDLGIDTLPVIIKEELIDEDIKVRQLIAANFGRLKNNDSKFRNAVAEYVKLNGNAHGGDRKSKVQSAPLKSQKEIANEMGISLDELKRILQLERSLTPEMKELLDTKKITKTTALSICGNLTKEEQAELAKELSAGNENMDINRMLEEKKKIQLENEKLKTEINAHATKELEYQQEIEQLSNQEPIIKEVVKQIKVVPTDYEELKQQVQTLSSEKDELMEEIFEMESVEEVPKHFAPKDFTDLVLKFSDYTYHFSVFLKSKTLLPIEQVEQYSYYVDLARHHIDIVQKAIKDYITTDVVENSNEQSNILVAEPNEEDTIPESMRITQEMMQGRSDIDDIEDKPVETSVEEPIAPTVELDTVEVRTKILTANPDMTLSQYFHMELNIPKMQFYNKLEKSLGMYDRNGELIFALEIYIQFMTEYEESKHDKFVKRIAKIKAQQNI